MRPPTGPRYYLIIFSIFYSFILRITAIMMATSVVGSKASIRAQPVAYSRSMATKVIARRALVIRSAKVRY